MEQTDPRRWWALGGLTLAVLAVGLDGTVLSVALPTLARSLHGMDAALTVSAGIAFAGVMLALLFVPRVKLPEENDEIPTAEEVTVSVR